MWHIFMTSTQDRTGSRMFWSEDDVIARMSANNALTGEGRYAGRYLLVLRMYLRLTSLS
jgi:hypothetical protein